MPVRHSKRERPRLVVAAAFSRLLRKTRESVSLARTPAPAVGSAIRPRNKTLAQRFKAVFAVVGSVVDSLVPDPLAQIVLALASVGRARSKVSASYAAFAVAARPRLAVPRSRIPSRVVERKRIEVPEV